jgi:hypothetical protein
MTNKRNAAIENIYRMRKRVQKWMQAIHASINKAILGFIDRTISILSKAELKLTKGGQSQSSWI